MINEYLALLTLAVYGSNEFSGPPWNRTAPCPTAMIVRPGRGPFCLEEPNGPYCQFPNMTLAHSALTHCSNIDTLDVGFDFPDCSGYVRDRPDFLFLEGERYPPLRSLKLDGYSFGGLHVAPDQEEVEMGYCMGPVRKGVDWDAESPWPTAHEWTESRNNELKKEWEEQQGRPKSNLDMWLEAMNWSQLEEFSLNTRRSEMFNVIAELPRRLTSLRVLHIDSLPFIEGLQNHTLEKLRWVGPTQPGHLNTILAQQGQSLKHLEYRCDELTCPNWRSHANTTLLPLLAPSLEKISINLHRASNGTWPLADLSTLARLPALKSADLYFRLQAPCIAHKYFLGFTHRNCAAAYRAYESCYGEDRYEAPFLNASTAAYMFSYLRSENPSKNLTSVTFRTGNWAESARQMWGGPFVEDRRSAVYCRVERGREVCEAVNEGYWKGHMGGEWEYIGETWIVDTDLEDLEQARVDEDEEQIERLEARMRGKIEMLQQERDVRDIVSQNFESV